MVKHLTLDLSSGLGVRVMTLGPMLGSVLGMKPTLKKKKTTSYFYIHSTISFEASQCFTAVQKVFFIPR